MVRPVRSRSRVVMALLHGSSRERAIDLLFLLPILVMSLLVIAFVLLSFLIGWLPLKFGLQRLKNFEA